MKQTAVEYLVEELERIGFLTNNIVEFENEVLIAKEMERQQIIDSISNANKSNNRNVSLNPEQYYKETFKTDKG